ncbi:latent-transforming growth factor beta-binding protein 2-like [Galendromus occidentalis]|uniref:Latent-transforming growth factor beta-binding protein 2-like n=1 Tax=Galendromus occidentalis TaxID=34638 RepID=A0AAJ7SER0_9ACAR|nr:latent-transforming growth factor beta-binding protein 2-like [Galendromus occidentalis]
MWKCSTVWLLLAILMAWASPSLAIKRAGNWRVCERTDLGLGCSCTRASDCYDYTRDRAGFCDTRSRVCTYCLYGQHLEGNFSAAFLSESRHRCVQSDSCEEILNERGFQTEVECVGGHCHRDGQKTDERCSCRSGYRFRRMWDSSLRCADDNECESWGRQHCARLHCINTEGSFECGCRPGYRLVNNGTKYEHCQEIDECEEVIGICPQSCRNVPGSFNCTCHLGYTSIREDGKMKCVDIDECQVLDSCHPLTTCHNTIGSFYCTTPVKAPASFGGWAMTLIPMFTCIFIFALCCRNRTLEQEILRLSSEDLAEKGRYEVSAEHEKIGVDESSSP